MLHKVAPGTLIKVAIADDDTLVRTALAELILGEPWLELVGQASDALEAVELCRTLGPDIILVDLKMPGGGGEHAIQEIEKLRGRTRCIALTAYGDRGSVLRVIRAGARGYLVKGVSSSEVLSTIEQVYNGQSFLSAEATTTVVQELATKLRTEERGAGHKQLLSARIRGAINGDTMSMVFQPIQRLADGKTIGFEALARFTPRDAGTIPEWFEVAREVGLLVDLEYAAAELAASQVNELAADAWLSLNLSPECVEHERFASFLEMAPAHRMVIELTEHARVRNYQALATALSHYRAVGGKVAVDDAGSGYSSLQHILELEPDFIKLDISICRGVESKVKQRAVISSLVALAEATASVVIAEGIESETQLNALESLGVLYGQGYHLGMPARLGTPAAV